MINTITKSQAHAFWRDLMGTLWHDPDTKETHGTMSASLIASHMEITEDEANNYMWACVHAKYSTRQNGAFVV